MQPAAKNPRSESLGPEPDQRSKRVKKAVLRGIKDWREARRPATLEALPGGRPLDAPEDEEGSDSVDIDALLDSPLARAWLDEGGGEYVDIGRERRPGRIAPLPRRKRIGRPPTTNQTPAMARTIEFRAGFFASLARFFVWSWAAIRYFGGTFKDALIGRNSVARRAVRLRKTLEGLGPTFIKLGQQMSVRADVLPYEYCAELSKMLDSIEPFDTKYAIAAIERSTGRPVTETFAVFDPEPIGSASLACVYQAILHNGEKVAVKVRRPNIGRKLAADLRALDWMLAFAELTAIVKPGLTRNLSLELVAMLMEELDFTREARYTAIFRKRAKDEQQDYITAPRVYRELTSEEVMVSELVNGVFLFEILNAIDRNDPVLLKQITDRGIDPKEIAIAMADLFNWESMESLLFHADPHPANIICKPGNTIVLIDFGACGRFSSKTRRLWTQLHHYMHREDVHGMVECSISMLEPLPPIDIERFTKEVEALYWEQMYASKDPHSEWWEKASGVLWIRFAGIARRYNIPMNLDTLRLFRATFLYDTVVFRLWKDLDLDEEFQRYFRKHGRRTKKRLRKELRKRLNDGLTNTDYTRVEDMMRMGNQIYARMQHYLDTPQHNFASAIGKAAYAVSVALRVAMAAFGVHLTAVVGVQLYASMTGETQDMWEAFGQLVSHPVYQGTALLIGLIVIRKALMRFEDMDVRQ